MIWRHMTLLSMLAGAALIVVPAWSRPDIRFIWNASTSVPIGLYRIVPGDQVDVTVRVCGGGDQQWVAGRVEVQGEPRELRQSAGREGVGGQGGEQQGPWGADGSPAAHVDPQLRPIVRSHDPRPGQKGQGRPRVSSGAVDP